MYVSSECFGLTTPDQVLNVGRRYVEVSRAGRVQGLICILVQGLICILGVNNRMKKALHVVHGMGA